MLGFFITEIRKTIHFARTSGWLKSSFFVSASKAFSSLTNLVFMVFAVNLLSKAENGQLQYYLGFLPVILAIAEFGLPSAIVKFLAPRTESRHGIGIVLGSSLFIKLLAFAFLLMLGFAFWTVAEESILVVTLLVMGGFVLSFNSFFESIFVSFGHYYTLAVWNPLPNLTRLAVLYLANRYSVEALDHLDILMIFAISPVFILIMFFFIFEKGILKWSADKDEIQSMTRELAVFNLYAFLASILAIVSDRLEIFFLNRYHGAEQVAIYGTALQLFSGFVILFSTVNSLIYPRLSRLVDNERFSSFLVQSVLITGALAILLFPGFFLAGPLLDLLFTGKYTESIPIFQILYPNYLLQLVFAPLGIALFALGEPRILALLALLRLIFGLLLDNLLIPSYGASGAATAFFLGQIVSWLILVGYFLSFFRSKHKNGG